ncbi:MAG: hypothetical protein KDI43_03710 [Gammaproteobacteria bacterium]|nr:hypothetical protein [Gammaproteobacteria bacterium]MCP5406264.1 hypothetical protein [Chromatiaceae bacterium]MCP5442827.1 hypothetical protein [Chromatiaceae bacterium]
MADCLRPVIMLQALILLCACSADPGTGPAEVKWDRTACERCRMVLSDRHFAAQVRYLPEGKRRSKVVQFDDFGCAALWLQDKPWKDDPTTQFWVADHRTGEWIDARAASYIKDKLTPMEYALGAQSDPAPGALDFEQAKVHVAEVEKRFSIHGVQLLDKLKAQQEKRETRRKSEPER